MFVMKDAVCVDGESVGNGGDVERLGDRAGEAAIAVLQPSHFVLSGELFPLLLVIVEADAEDDQSLPLKVSGDIAHMGKRDEGTEV